MYSLSTMLLNCPQCFVSKYTSSYDLLACSQQPLCWHLGCYNGGRYTDIDQLNAADHIAAQAPWLSMGLWIRSNKTLLPLKVCQAEMIVFLQYIFSKLFHTLNYVRGICSFHNTDFIYVLQMIRHTLFGLKLTRNVVSSIIHFELHRHVKNNCTISVIKQVWRKHVPICRQHCDCRIRYQDSCIQSKKVKVPCIYTGSKLGFNILGYIGTVKASLC